MIRYHLDVSRRRVLHRGVHAIVLAAGAGRRLGGRKARLCVGGETLLALHLRSLRAAGFAVTAAVHPDDLALAAMVRAVPSTAPDQAGSLALALAALPADDAPVLVVPVDMVPVSPDTLARIVAALAPGVDAVIPCFEGRRGHPPMLRRTLLRAFDDGAPPLRDVLAAMARPPLLLETADPTVVTDLDDAAAVLRATGSPPTFA